MIKKIIQKIAQKMWLCLIYKRLNDVPTQKDYNYCPFCKIETQLEYKTVEKLYHFNIIYNKFKYPYTAEHLLILPKRHIKKWSELSYNEMQELQALISNALDKWYMLLWRHYPNAGSSIEHLHIHLIKNV